MLRKNHDKTPMTKMLLAFALSLEKYLRDGFFLGILPSLDVSYGNPTQPAFTCSKLITETLEQGVKYVQS